MTRGRIIAVVVGLLLVAVLVGGALLVRSLLSPQKFTSMLRAKVAEAGLQMHLAEPAQPTLWPDLAVELRGLRLRRVGHDEPMLRARRVLLVVPWGSVLQGQVQIRNLRVLGPTIDIAQMQAWLASLQEQSATTQPRLPTIGAGVHVADGTLVKGNKLLLKSLQLDTGALRAGQPFKLAAQALDSKGNALELRLATTAAQTADGVSLDPLKLHLAADASAVLQLSGKLLWRGGLNLVGAMQGGLQLADKQYQVVLESLGDANHEGASSSVRIGVDGDGAQLDMVLAPAQALAWWQQISDSTNGSSGLPPVQGTLTVDAVQWGALQIKGLRVQSKLPAARASSSAQPALASSVGSKP